MTRRARDVLIDILRDEGITHVFGNPGSTEMPLMDARVDTPDIRYVLGLQEATAVGMADGWALATGRTAFVNLHAMGGLGKAMGVLVASKASGTPIVVAAGQQDTRHLMTEPWLSGDLVSLAAPVTKWAKELRRGDDVGPALRRAFALARTPPCGPVFLSFRAPRFRPTTRAGLACPSPISPTCARICNRYRRLCSSAGGRSSAYPYREAEPGPEDVAVVHIADNPEAFRREHAADAALFGDISQTLSAVATRLGALVDRDKVAKRLATRGAGRREAQEVTRKDILAESARGKLSADAVVLAAIDALPEDAIIANDSAATFGRIPGLLTTKPRRYFFARGGVLGCSMPVAVGASLATDGWVVAFVRDGGAMYSLQALWSAAHNKTRTIFVVFNNRRYGVFQKRTGAANPSRCASDKEGFGGHMKLRQQRRRGTGALAERRFNVLSERLRSIVRRIAAPDAKLPVDQELGEIPLDRL